MDSLDGLSLKLFHPFLSYLFKKNQELFLKINIFKKN